MKSKIKKLEGTAREFEIEMPKERVEEIFNQVLEDIKKTAKIPGFREGKAPTDLVHKLHHKAAMDEVKQRLIPEAYQEALKKHDLNPISYPEISDVSIDPSGAFLFKAKFDIEPEIALKKYKTLTVSVPKIGVSDDEVNKALHEISNLYAEFIDIEGPLKKGDFGICDVETFLDGKPVSKKRENMRIEVNKDASLLGMGESLEGMTKLAEKDIETTLPENYPDKKYTGKKVVFHVKVRETKKKVVPEINDELAKKVGKTNVDEVREEIKSQLVARKEANSKILMENQIMEQLLKDHSFDLPGSMVERQLKVLMEKAEEELKQKGVDAAAIASHKDAMRDGLRKEAKDKVKLYFILDKIAICEKIDVRDEEIDNWIKALADSYSQDFDKVKKYYQEHNLIGGLKEQLREDKTLGFLLAEANVSVAETK